MGFEEGTERMTPENSEPEIQGKGGWCWYLPRIWRRSKKLVAVAWIAIRYWSFEGMGSDRVVTVSSSGPWGMIRDIHVLDEDQVHNHQ